MALGLFTWGSWQDPKLSQYARPVTYLVFNTPHLQSATDSAQLLSQVEHLPGVTACAIRPASQRLVMAFNPDSLSQEEECQRLGLTVQPPAPPAPIDPSIRQCPVPAGYVLALEKVRFFFNLRRLYIKA